MSEKEKVSSISGIRVKGLLVEKGVRISKNQNVDEISSRGYGVAENNELLLTFYEALYLLGKGFLEVEDEKGKKVPMVVKKGQKVLYKKWAGNEVKVAMQEWLLVEQKDVMAVIE